MKKGIVVYMSKVYIMLIKAYKTRIYTVPKRQESV